MLRRLLSSHSYQEVKPGLEPDLRDRPQNLTPTTPPRPQK